MKAAWTSRAVGALLLALVSLPAQAQEDEETTFLRRSEETTIVRPEAATPPDTPAPRFFDSRIKGSFYEKWAFDVQHEGGGEDVVDVRTRFDLIAEVTGPDQLKFYIAGRMSHFVVSEDAGDDTWWVFNGNNAKWEYEPELREAYVYYPNDLVNLRVGNQIVRWGFGQMNKPSDVLNPVDYREGLYNDLEVPLIPVFMVHLDRSFGPLNLSAVWQPFFTPNRTTLFGQDWSPLSAMSGNPAFSQAQQVRSLLGLIQGIVNPRIEDRVQPILLGTHPPEESFENGQFGAHAELNLPAVDLQASYYYGWDKLPWVFLNQEFLPDVATIQAFLAGEADMLDALGAVTHLTQDEEGNPRNLTAADLFSTSYRRQHTVGAGASTVLFDRIGCKLDAAFSPERTVFLESPTGFPTPAGQPTLSYSVGFDYRYSTWFDILAEFYHFHVFDLDGDERVFVIGEDLYMTTLASHLRFLDFDALEFQLAGMVEWATRNLFFFPKVSYKVTQNGRIAVGAMLVEVLPGGDERGPAGLFDRNDAVYFDIRWSF